MDKSARPTIEALNGLLAAANADAGTGGLGACTYDPGDGTLICADGFTKDQCDALKGKFVEGGVCPPKPAS